jgi:autotransporter-associated beta strand protein
MTTVPRRRAVRAAIALGFLYIAASARSQSVLVNTTLSQTHGSNPGPAFYEFQNGTVQDASGGTYTTGVVVDPNFNGTIDAHGNSSTWSGIFSGTGNLLTLTDSVGGGAIALTGNNTYSGVLAISGVKVGIGTANVNVFGTGTVSLTNATLQNQFGAGNTSSILNNFQLNGNNVFDANSALAGYSGTIFGTGGLTLENTGGGALGIIQLSGTNYYSGPTVVPVGMTTIIAQSGFGTGAVSLGGGNQITLLNANLPNAFTLGAGGTGVTTLNPLVGDVATLTGPIGGAGGLALASFAAGTVVLSGGGSWSGGTVVSGGTLQMGAAGVMPSAGALTVNSGGTFDLNGFNQGSVISPVGAVTMTGTGVLKTGAATLTAASYTAAAGSSLGVFPIFGSAANPATANLNVTGAANMGSETLFIEQRPASGLYTLVNTGAGISNFSFSGGACPAGTSFTDGLCLPTGYTGVLTVLAGNELQLALTAPSLILAGQSANQASIANALNNTNAAASSDMSAILSNLNLLAVTSPTQLAASLDQLSPIAFTAMSGLAASGAGVQAEAVSRRVAALQTGLADAGGGRFAYYDVGGRSPYPGTLVAEGGGGPVPAPDPPDNPIESPWGLYFSGLYTQGRLDGINGTAGFQPGYDFDSFGGMLGVDYRFGEGFAAGVTAGYVQGSSTLDNGVGQVSDDSIRFGAYGTFWSDALHGTLYLGSAMDSFSTSRNLPSFGRTATASPGGNEFNLDASAGYDLKYGRATLTPFGGLSYDRLHVDSFSEGGAGALDLNVGSLAFNSLRSSFGVKTARRFGFDEDWFGLTPSASLGWEHEFADQSRAIGAQFSAGGGSFSTATADVSRDALLAGLGLAIGFGKDVTLRFDYSGDYRSDFNAKTLDGSLRVRF